jgi:hypothetical protein
MSAAHAERALTERALAFVPPAGALITVYLPENKAEADKCRNIIADWRTELNLSPTS